MLCFLVYIVKNMFIIAVFVLFSFLVLCVFLICYCWAY